MGDKRTGLQAEIDVRKARDPIRRKTALVKAAYMLSFPVPASPQIDTPVRPTPATLSIHFHQLKSAQQTPHKAGEKEGLLQQKGYVVV